MTLIVCMAFCLCSCTYLKHASVQAEYARIQAAAPGQLNVKHMLDRDTYFVHGKNEDEIGRYSGLQKAIVAFSSKYQANEPVDTMYFEATGTHFGMNLPEGNYELLVFADINGDGVMRPSEVVGRRSVKLNNVSAPGKVLGQVNVQLTEPVTIDWDISIGVPGPAERPDSIFYPSGAIRSMDDPIFDSSFAMLGMYDPAAFLEQEPTMFYALEEELGYKMPVVFIHGIAGSPREFKSFVGRLDRSRYKPLFFYYPSGGDLDQLAELFYQIYLSGEVYNSGDMPIIVIAHSMGGLVAREAINKYKGSKRENQVHLFVTIATPFGGHPAAAAGEKHGKMFKMVLPSWRDLNPENQFIGNLYKKPLPEFVHHELIYAYQDPRAIKIGEKSDGVVALSSQLHPPAQRQAKGQIGFNYTHTSILDSKEVFTYISDKMKLVKNAWPPAQISLLRQGGYDVPLGENYSPRAQYWIRNYGKYLMALTNGTLSTFHPDEDHFIAIVHGEKPPRNDEDEGWLRFLSEYPELKDD